MHRIHVGVLRGGPSREHDVSLKTGEVVIKHIPDDIYEVQDIFISRDGTWHRQGIPIAPTQAISRVDVIFNALHGHYGEDGKVQHILELHGIPFTGSGSFSSSLGMNKSLTKEIFKREKIKTPQYKIVDKSENLNPEKLISLFRSFPLPLVVKPISSAETYIVKDFTSFGELINKAFECGDSVIVEEFIPGVEATVGIIDTYREQPTYALPILSSHPFSSEQKIEIENLAKKVHQSLGLRHYSSADFIVNPKRGIFVLGASALPKFSDKDSIPKALADVGASLSHFFHHVLQLAMNRK